MPYLRSQGNASVFVGSSQPVSSNNGDIWIDTSGAVNLIKINTSGTFAAISSKIGTASNPGNPTGTASTSLKMMGLAGAYTPSLSGRCIIIISCAVANTLASDGIQISFRYGTGTAPSNGDAVTGASPLSTINIDAGINTQRIPVTLPIFITLTVGTAYWFDVAIAAITGGTASMSQATIQYVELP